MGAVVEAKDFSTPLIRRKALSARNGATLATIDEPIAHGGTGLGASPHQAVLGAPCACEGVTFGRTAAEVTDRHA